jgi:GTPase KRas protein
MDPNRLNITICGDGGCGKSSITLRLVRSAWTSDYDPTIEDSYSITRRIDGETYHLSLTDTAGQEEYRGMWAGTNLTADAFLMVYDITSMASLAALDEFDGLIEMETANRRESIVRARAAHKTGSTWRQRTRGAADKTAGSIALPVKMVAGNKCDLPESREVEARVGLEWARARGCGFMETSARNSVNIEETFALIVRRVVKARTAALREAGLLAGEEDGGLAGRSSGASSTAMRQAATTNAAGPGTGSSSPGLTLEKGWMEVDEEPKGFWRSMCCCCC